MNSNNELEQDSDSYNSAYAVETYGDDFFMKFDDWKKESIEGNVKLKHEKNGMLQEIRCMKSKAKATARQKAEKRFEEGSQRSQRNDEAESIARRKADEAETIARKNC